jgi:hypothetical protein
MRQLELKSREISVIELRKRSALESDTSRVIKDPCVVTQNGSPIIIYGKFEKSLSPLALAVRRIKYQGGTRDSGLKTTSRTFGFCPRIPLRGHNFCSVSNLAYTDPVEHQILCNFGKRLSEIYEREAPVHFRKHAEALKSIRTRLDHPGNSVYLRHRE